MRVDIVITAKDGRTKFVPKIVNKTLFKLEATEWDFYLTSLTDIEDALKAFTDISAAFPQYNLKSIIYKTHTYHWSSFAIGPIVTVEVGANYIAIPGEGKLYGFNKQDIEKALQILKALQPEN